MEKLELKHLAPYLPYELILMTNMGIVKLIGSNINTCLDESLGRKPILRSLSDLTKEIEINGEKFVPNKAISKNKDFNDCIWNLITEFPAKTSELILTETSYKVVQKLFEWHFDVFGLIDKGLAIDINTIE